MELAFVDLVPRKILYSHIKTCDPAPIPMRTAIVHCPFHAHDSASALDILSFRLCLMLLGRRSLQGRVSRVVLVLIG